MHKNLSAAHRIGQLSARTLGVRPLLPDFAPLQLLCSHAIPLHLITIVNDAISAHPQSQVTARARANGLPACDGPPPQRHHWDGRRHAEDQQPGLPDVLFWVKT